MRPARVSLPLDVRKKVALPDVDRAAAHVVAERLRSGIAELELPEPGSDAANRHEPETGSVTATLVVACWGDDEQRDAATIFRAIDDALCSYPRVPNRVSEVDHRG